MAVISKPNLAVVPITAGLLFSAMLSTAFSLPLTQQKKPVKSAAGSSAALVSAGKAVYDKQGCANCHAIAGKGGNAGPDLTAAGAVAGHNAAWFAVQVANPKAHNPNTTMPAFAQTIKGQNLTALSAYLVSLKGASDAASGGAAPHRSAGKSDPAATAKIEKAGGLVGPLAANDDRLDVNFRMAGAAITDKDVAVLSGLKSVYSLNLGQTGVTDAGLAHLAGLKDLTELHLEGTRITDTGLQHLSHLTNLTYLNLYGTGITDAGLDHLSHLTNLKHLYVWQTKVTQAGVDKLKKQLPQLEIVQGWEDAPKK